MKIAQVAPPYESVLPKYYGGTERVMSYLTRCQGQMAHHFVMSERVFQRAGEQRSTATRMAHDCRQKFGRLIARNQEVSEAA
jgi:hypothetical protein